MVVWLQNKRTTSVMWEWHYFGIKSYNLGNLLTSGLEYPVCKLFQKFTLAKSSDTSNLFKHIENNHPEVFSAS